MIGNISNDITSESPKQINSPNLRYTVKGGGGV